MNEEPELQSTLRKEFEHIINKHCGENEANVPDFILADYLVRCFNVFNHATKERDRWYSVKLSPGNSKFNKG